MEGQLKKKLIKYLLEDKVCNLVTEIFSTERESVPAPNTEVFLRRSIIEPAEPGFSYQPLLLKEENTLRFFEPIAKEERLIILGGGHISKYLCEFAAKTGFAVWVIDERQEFANKERFPDANWLGKQRAVRAMMDLSDGLASDLGHILKASGAGAEISVERIPTRTTVELAVTGGEDYRLLLTTDPDEADALIERYAQRFGTPLYEIGRIIEGSGIRWKENGRAIRPRWQGFRHF